MEWILQAELIFVFCWKYVWLVIVISTSHLNVTLGLIRPYDCHHSLHGSLSFILLIWNLQCDLEKLVWKFRLCKQKKTFLVKMFQLFRNLFLKDNTHSFNLISLQCIVKLLYGFETLKTKEFNTTLLNFSCWFFLCVM